MYFTKIRLRGLSVVDFPIVGAYPSDMYILKSVVGLGPPEVDVSIINTLNAGGYYQGRRPQTREVVLHIGLNPNYGLDQTATQLRETLYGMLTPGLNDIVSLELMDVDTIVAYTTGYVKKLEIAPFSQTPEVQLTLSCVQQYLMAPGDLYLGNLDKIEPHIDNIGTAPSGFQMNLTFTAAVTNWTLLDGGGNKMDLRYNFLSASTLTIDTRPGSRKLSVVEGGIPRNIVYTLTPDSVWHMLHGGLNIFVTSSQLFNWGDVFYLPQYWGV